MVVTEAFDASAIDRLGEAFGGVTVEHLNLEEIFVELLGDAPATARPDETANA